METTFLSSAIRQFDYYRSLGEKTIARLSAEQLNWQYNPESNSVAIMVRHLSGNMLSRWTDFLTSDGEKPWRQREAEFDNGSISRDSLLEAWDKGWECLFSTLRSLREEDLSKEIFIRNQGHTVMEAINRQLAHYPYHIGQIVYIGKMVCNDQWQSLSIPRGGTDRYNAEKFSREKHREHFTDEFLKPDSPDSETQAG